MNRKERRLLATVERSPLAWELRELVQEQAAVRTSSLYLRHITHHAPDGQITRRREIECWCSGAQWLLDKLNSRAATINKESENWPTTAQQMGVMLNKLTRGLLLKNVRVTYSRHELYGRLWTLSLLDNFEIVDTLPDYKDFPAVRRTGENHHKPTF